MIMATIHATVDVKVIFAESFKVQLQMPACFSGAASSFQIVARWQRYNIERQLQQTSASVYKCAVRIKQNVLPTAFWSAQDCMKYNENTPSSIFNIPSPHLCSSWSTSTSLGSRKNGAPTYKSRATSHSLVSTIYVQAKDCFMTSLRNSPRILAQVDCGI